jgi:hypothetical protein
MDKMQVHTKETHATKGMRANMGMKEKLMIVAGTQIFHNAS